MIRNWLRAKRIAKFRSQLADKELIAFHRELVWQRRYESHCPTAGFVAVRGYQGMLRSNEQVTEGSESA
jgi:hypothetical protein